MSSHGGIDRRTSNTAFNLEPFGKTTKYHLMIAEPSCPHNAPKQHFLISWHRGWHFNMNFGEDTIQIVAENITVTLSSKQWEMFFRPKSGLNCI